MVLGYAANRVCTSSHIQQEGSYLPSVNKYLVVYIVNSLRTRMLCSLLPKARQHLRKEQTTRNALRAPCSKVLGTHVSEAYSCSDEVVRMEQAGTGLELHPRTACKAWTAALAFRQHSYYQHGLIIGLASERSRYRIHHAMDAPMRSVTALVYM